MNDFKAGDLVVIVTVNEGRPVRNKRDAVEQTWAAKIIGPSPIGEGWWIVRAIDPATGKPTGWGAPRTVPEDEMKKP